MESGREDKENQIQETLEKAPQATREEKIKSPQQNIMTAGSSKRNMMRDKMQYKRIFLRSLYSQKRR